MRSPRLDGDACYKTKARGLAVLTTPLLNKGTAFTAEERKDLGLTGLLPPVISTLSAQVKARHGTQLVMKLPSSDGNGASNAGTGASAVPASTGATKVSGVDAS